VEGRCTSRAAEHRSHPQSGLEEQFKHTRGIAALYAGYDPRSAGWAPLKRAGEDQLLSHRDDWTRHWEQYADAAQQNPAQDYRRRVILSLLDLPPGGAGVRLLDIGSGQGDLAVWVQRKFPAAQILGLELSEAGVAISQSKVPSGTFVQRNLLQTQQVPEEQRDWATHAVCSEVIEHVDHPDILLRHARDYMTSGCKLIVTAPGGPMSSFDKFIGHRKHFRAPDVHALLSKAGYEPKWASGAGFPFFNLYRLVVILRGEKLIEDARAQNGRQMPWLASMVMRVFQFLFRFNLTSSPLGWQMIAKATMANRADPL
jgi:SAM-dependent methyltransferase